jgi:hypothetical protein
MNENYCGCNQKSDCKDREFCQEKTRTDLGLSQACCACPSGWTVLDTGCYKILGGSKKKWTDGMDLCIKAGGRLAKVDSAEEQDAIMAGIAAAGYSKDTHLAFWIGATYKDGTWIWHWPGSPKLADGYTKWRNNYPRADQPNSKFGLMALAMDGKWRDWENANNHNGRNFGVVCELVDPCT